MSFAQTDSILHPFQKIFINGSYDLSRHWSFGNTLLYGPTPNSYTDPPKENRIGWSGSINYYRRLTHNVYLGSGIIFSSFSYQETIEMNSSQVRFPTPPVTFEYYSGYSTSLLQLPLDFQLFPLEKILALRFGVLNDFRLNEKYIHVVDRYTSFSSSSSSTDSINHSDIRYSGTRFLVALDIEYINNSNWVPSFSFSYASQPELFKSYQQLLHFGITSFTFGLGYYFNKK